MSDGVSEGYREQRRHIGWLAAQDLEELRMQLAAHKVDAAQALESDNYTQLDSSVSALRRCNRHIEDISAARKAGSQAANILKFDRDKLNMDHWKYGSSPSRSLEAIIEMMRVSEQSLALIFAERVFKEYVDQMTLDLTDKHEHTRKRAEKWLLDQKLNK